MKKPSIIFTKKDGYELLATPGKRNRTGRPFQGHLAFTPELLKPIPDRICVRALARALMIAQSTIQFWMAPKEDERPVLKSGKDKLVKKSDLIAYLKATDRYEGEE